MEQNASRRSLAHSNVVLKKYEQQYATALTVSRCKLESLKVCGAIRSTCEENQLVRSFSSKHFFLSTVFALFSVGSSCLHKVRTRGGLAQTSQN